MKSLTQIAKACGFKAGALDGAAAWISAKKGQGSVIGHWDGSAFSLHLNPQLHADLIGRWKAEGIAVEDGQPVAGVDSVWTAMDFFSEGDMDFLVAGSEFVEFPAKGKEMIRDLKGYLFKKEGERNAGNNAPVSSDIRNYAAEAGKDPFLMNLWGKILSHQQDAGEAGKAFRAAVDLMPEFGEPYSNLGTLLWQHGQRRDAFLLFAEGVIKNPHSIACQLNFFDASYEMQEYKAMITVIEKILPDAADCVEFKHHLAIGYQRLGQPERAIACLKEILAANPSDPEALNLLKSFQEGNIHTT